MIWFNFQRASLLLSFHCLLIADSSGHVWTLEKKDEEAVGEPPRTHLSCVDRAIWYSETFVLRIWYSKTDMMYLCLDQTCNE